MAAERPVAELLRTQHALQAHLLGLQLAADRRVHAESNGLNPTLIVGNLLYRNESDSPQVCTLRYEMPAGVGIPLVRSPDRANGTTVDCFVVNNEVVSLLLDPGEAIWIGATVGGLVRFAASRPV